MWQCERTHLDADEGACVVGGGQEVFDDRAHHEEGVFFLQKQKQGRRDLKAETGSILGSKILGCKGWVDGVAYTEEVAYKSEYSVPMFVLKNVTFPMMT